MTYRDAIEQQIVKDWSQELSIKLGRPAADILQHGLAATDFPSNNKVTLTFPDKSSVHFRYAVFVENKLRQKIAVFTEHCGYHVFPSSDAIVE